jgi:hypothetical protein
MSILKGEQTKNSQKQDSIPWKYLYQIFIKPKHTFSFITERDERAWLKPMLILSVLVILLALSGGPARRMDVLMNASQMPEGFQYWTEDQQNQFFQSQQAAQGSLFIYVFPLVSALAGLWLGWFILGNILHLIMTFQGSHQPQEAYLNLVAWAALPFALRSVVQILALLLNKRVIDDPGLSGFIQEGSKGILAYLRILLSMVDIYSIAFILLLMLGSPIFSGLKIEKVWWPTLLACFILVILTTVPEFLLLKLDSLETIRPFLYF